MLGHGHFRLGDRDEAVGETALGFESPLGRTSPSSLERSGVDSSDVLLEARTDLVERVEAGLELGVCVAPYSAIVWCYRAMTSISWANLEGKGKIDSGEKRMVCDDGERRDRWVETSRHQPRGHCIG